jgi:hypothetical protein
MDAASYRHRLASNPDPDPRATLGEAIGASLPPRLCRLQLQIAVRFFCFPAILPPPVLASPRVRVKCVVMLGWEARQGGELLPFNNAGGSSSQDEGTAWRSLWAHLSACVEVLEAGALVTPGDRVADPRVPRSRFVHLLRSSFLGRTVTVSSVPFSAAGPTSARSGRVLGCWEGDDDSGRV